jgi:hypothetical protein
MTTRRRWLVRIGVIAAIVALLVVFRQPILRGLADQLIVNEPSVPGAAHLILGGDCAPELAVKVFLDGNATEILLVDWWPDRTDRLGITSSHSATLRRALVKHGVPEPSIQSLPGQPRDLYQTADGVGTWLDQHPDKHLIVYCNRFSSRQVQVIFQRVLGERRERVHLQAVAHPEFDERDWWQQKTGLKDFWAATVHLLFTWTHDRPHHDYPDWDPDAYEKGLQ